MEDNIILSVWTEYRRLLTRVQLMNNLLSPSVTLRGVACLNVPYRVLNVQNGTVNLERMTVRWQSASNRIFGLVQHPTLTHKRPSYSDQSFRSIGLEQSLVQALQKAFPNIKRPTKVQDRLITEILGGRDILLKDGTGSGKYGSFLFIGYKN